MGWPSAAGLDKSPRAIRATWPSRADKPPPATKASISALWPLMSRANAPRGRPSGSMPMAPLPDSVTRSNTTRSSFTSTMPPLSRQPPRAFWIGPPGQAPETAPSNRKLPTACPSEFQAMAPELAAPAGSATLSASSARSRVLAPTSRRAWATTRAAVRRCPARLASAPAISSERRRQSQISPADTMLARSRSVSRRARRGPP